MTLTSIMSGTAALAAVLAAILLTGALARRSSFAMRRGSRPNRLTVLDTLNLDPRRRLVLVQCDDRCLLLLTGPQDHVVGWLQQVAP